MGNCCGKSESDAAFQGEGRTLNATPATASYGSSGGRSAAKPKVSGPGRTLGSTPAGSGQPTTPGEAAARAAEQRLNAPKGGKLQQQLNAQKSQTHNDTLAQTARDNLAVRSADANTQARNYN